MKNWMMETVDSQQVKVIPLPRGTDLRMKSGGYYFLWSET